MAFRVQGVVGPSGVDAISWRSFCSSFKFPPDLCPALALLACRLCTTYFNPVGLVAFVACRLIALDKNCSEINWDWGDQS